MEENYSTWRQLKSFKGVEFNNLGEYRDKKSGKPIKKRAYWRPIKGYPDYDISNFGEISSNKFNKRIRLKPGKNSSGYYVVHLSKNKISKMFLLHRLVAENFIENKNKYPQINHIDGTKSNNQVTNLEWVTSKQNMKHAWQTGLYENSRKSAKKNIIIATEARKIPIYSKDLDLKFESLTEAAIYLQSNYFENIKLEFLINYIFKLLNNKVVKSKYDFGFQYVLTNN